MYVNKYKIRQPHLSGSTGVHLNIPFGQNPWLVDQTDIIQTKFVDIEVENAINPIFDYETVRFIPVINNTHCDFVTYNIHMLDNGTYPTNTFWSDIDFTTADFSRNKNSYRKTFLRLDFYDNDIATKQRLLFFKTIFTQGKTFSIPSNEVVNFNVGNTLIDRNRNAEGFFLYYFKEDVIPTVPKELYMRATLLNAKNGTATSFMSSLNPSNGIDILAKQGSGKLYTKYLLKREAEGYYYEIDDTYSGNIIKTTGGQTNYTVDLYEISVL